MDTEDPAITDNNDVTVEEGGSIDDMVFETDEPSEIVVEGLPEGLEYDPETGIIRGTSSISDRSDSETSRDYAVTIEATDEVGNASSYVFNIVIERDLSRTDDSNFLATAESQNIVTICFRYLNGSYWWVIHYVG